MKMTLTVAQAALGASSNNTNTSMATSNGAGGNSALGGGNSSSGGGGGVGGGHNSASDGGRSSPSSSSPRGSPRPSPRPQTRRDHGSSPSPAGLGSVNLSSSSGSGGSQGGRGLTSNRHSDSHLSVTSRDSYGPISSTRLDASPTSPDGGGASSQRSSAHSVVELVVGPDLNRLEIPAAPAPSAKSAPSKPKKKSSWYSGLYPTYKSRSDEFKKLFKDVIPEDDRLVVDYSCALQKDILLQGRLYITQTHMCFYANIFGWETTVMVKWCDVTAVTKEKTALVIPNAILVTTSDDRYFFASLVARDKSYLMLFRIWQNALMSTPMNSRDLWLLVHQCYGEELGLTSDDEDYISPTCADDDRHSGRFSLDTYSEECASNADGAAIDQLLSDERGGSEQDTSGGGTAGSTQPMPVPMRSGTGAHHQPHRVSVIRESVDDIGDHHLPTDMSDTSDSDGEKPSRSTQITPVRPSRSLKIVPTTTKKNPAKNISSKSVSIKHSPKPTGKGGKSARKHRSMLLAEQLPPTVATPEAAAAATTVDTTRAGDDSVAVAAGGEEEVSTCAMAPSYDYNHEQDLPPQPDPSRSSSDEKLYPVCTALHEGRKLLNEVIPMHVDQLFTLLFTPSKFYLDFHRQRRTTDLSHTEWSYANDGGTKTRTVNLTAALNQLVGPKTSHVTEIQTMLPCSKAGFLYAIDVDASNAGIPYADSFGINFHYCLHKISDNQSSIAVYGQIKYKKSVFGLVKGMIERNTWQGMEDFFGAMGVALQLETEAAANPLEKRKVRTKQRPRSIQRTLERPPIRNSISKPTVPTVRTLKTDFATLVVFGILIVLVVLNVLLYYKLWSLEEAPPFTMVDLHLIKNAPKSHDEWIKLLQQQEILHTVEMQKWRQVLNTAIKLLKQTEESLNELQESINPTYSNKVMSVLEKHGVPGRTDDL